MRFHLSYIADDWLFLVGTFGLTFLVGIPIISLFSSQHLKNRFLASSVAGYGFMAFATTVLYKKGVSHQLLYKIFIATAVIVIVGLAIKRHFEKSDLPKVNAYTYLFLIFLAFIVVLYLPYYFGGLKFAAFQGWIHDNFSYLAASLTYTHETYREVNQSSGEFFLRSPVSVMGAIELHRRPGVMHLFGVLSQINSTEQYRYGYLFLVFLMGNGILASSFLMTNIFNVSILRAFLVSGAIFLGFWGQSFIDFNAWAMAGSIPVLLVITTYIISISGQISKESEVKFKELIPVTLLYGFAIYLYPENSIFHLPALIGILFLFGLQKFRTLEPKRALFTILKSTLTIILGILLFCIPYYRGTIEWFLWAAKFAASNVLDHTVWGNYLEPLFGQNNWFRPLVGQAVAYSQEFFKEESPRHILEYVGSQIFFHGKLNLLFYGFVDGFYGLFGMYFLLHQKAQIHQFILFGESSY